MPILSRALDGIRPLLGRLADLARAFGELPQSIQTGVVALLAMAPVFGAVSLGIGGLLVLLAPLRARVSAAQAAVRAWSAASTPAAKGTRVLSAAIRGLGLAARTLLGPVGLVVWALWEVGAALWGAEESLDDTTQATREGDQAWQDYGDTLQEVAGSHAAAVDRMAVDVLTGVGSFEALSDEAARVRGQETRR